jgi:rubredoxin
MGNKGEILSLELLVYSRNPISPGRETGLASERFLNRLERLLAKDKKMAEWDIVVEVIRDNSDCGGITSLVIGGEKMPQKVVCPSCRKTIDSLEERTSFYYRWDDTVEGYVPVEYDASPGDLHCPECEAELPDEVQESIVA